jgi:hypothetical protein
MEIIDIRTLIDEIHQAPVDLRKTDMIDSIARAICSSNCEAHNMTPCWSFHTDRPDAMEWPNPFCDHPGCIATAKRVYQEIEGDFGDG